MWDGKSRSFRSYIRGMVFAIERVDGHVPVCCLRVFVWMCDQGAYPTKALKRWRIGKCRRGFCRLHQFAYLSAPARAPNVNNMVCGYIATSAATINAHIPLQVASTALVSTVHTYIQNATLDSTGGFSLAEVEATNPTSYNIL